MILLMQRGTPVVFVHSHIVLGTGSVQRSHGKLVTGCQVGDPEKNRG